jgi:hypothetical protein
MFLGVLMYLLFPFAGVNEFFYWVYRCSWVNEFFYWVYRCSWIIFCLDTVDPQKHLSEPQIPGYIGLGKYKYVVVSEFFSVKLPNCIHGDISFSFILSCISTTSLPQLDWVQKSLSLLSFFISIMYILCLTSLIPLFFDCHFFYLHPFWDA